MNEIIRSNIEPKRRLKWNRRPARSGPLIIVEKEPAHYKLQLETLTKCLEVFFSEREYVKLKKHEYLEVTFFFDYSKIDRQYMTDLFKNGLKIVKAVKLNEGTQIYFKIVDFEKTYKYLFVLMNQFKAYVEDGKVLNNKRIKLWKFFQLSTINTKDRATYHITSFDRISLQVDFIEKIPKKVFKQYVLSAALKSGIGIDSVNIYGNKIELEGIDKSARKAKDFIQRIANIDRVMLICLSEFVSFVENITEGLKVDYSGMNIEKVNPKAAVVAVIDSGVQWGHLTKDILVGGLDYTKDNNPYEDNVGHGTAVASEIAYGENIHDYFVSKSTDTLLPLARIFSVKVFSKNEQTVIDYEKILDFKGKFAEAIVKYNIKIINISANSVNPKKFDEFSISKSASLLDAFAKEFNVVFVVSAGNIYPKFLKNLAKKHKKLEFYKRPDEFLFTNDENAEEINIGSPADQIAGITVGSCTEQNSKIVASSFSKSFKINSSSYFTKPDVLAIGGGDYPVDLSGIVPIFNENSKRVPVIHKSFQYLEFRNGTSFSAPRVSRTLAIGLLKYPNLSAEELKGIFLHKISNYKVSSNKKGEKKGELNLEIQKENFDFDNSFCAKGALIEHESDIIFSDTDDQITYIIKNKIKSNEIITFEVPLAKMLGDGSNKRYNKLQLKASVCILPSNDGAANLTVDTSNTFHVAALVHLSNILPTTTKITPKRTLSDQCVTTKTPGVLLDGWTCDYYQKHNPTFSSRSKNYIKDDLIQLAGNDENISVSIRGFNSNKEDKAPKMFTLLFSVEDLGETGQIRNDINIEI